MSETQTKLPVIYHPKYSFGWSMHGYDRCKSTNVKNMLVKNGLLKESQIQRPEPVTDEELALIHSDNYLKTLKDKNTLSKIFYMECMNSWYLPRFVSEYAFVTPSKYHAGGTILAGKQALEHGWAINLGGGAHHASAESGQGFCMFADLSISIKQMRRDNTDIKNIMIIDLDAHQGNGHERDFLDDPGIFTIDFYTYMGEDFYPNDTVAMQKIDFDCKLKPLTEEAEYLGKLKDAFKHAGTAFKPDIIYYVAGTDVLAEDKIGAQAMTAAGVIKRDEMVFDFAFEQQTPITMVFGGGYQKNNASVIAGSIENLHNRFGLFKPVCR